MQALNTLVAADGHTPAIDNYADKALPLSPEDKARIRVAAKRMNEAMVKQQLGVEHWVHNVDFLESLELLTGRPTVNIEGLVSGYTGPGGKTILPHKAIAKLGFAIGPRPDRSGFLRRVESPSGQARLRRYRSQHDRRLRSHHYRCQLLLIRAQASVRSQSRPSIPSSGRASPAPWPGYIFTGEPLKLPAGHFGLGHGNGAHAPNEYYVIESANPKIQGISGAIRAQVDYLYELAL